MDCVDTIKKPKAKSGLEFIQVIFANGQDDDSYGVAAWLSQRENVLYEATVYKPGEEVTVYAKTLLFKRGVEVIDAHGDAALRFGNPKTAIKVTAHKVVLTIKNCHIDCGGGDYYIRDAQ